MTPQRVTLITLGVADLDKAKAFYNENISPSGIQQQGMPAAEQAVGTALCDDAPCLQYIDFFCQLRRQLVGRCQ